MVKETLIVVPDLFNTDTFCGKFAQLAVEPSVVRYLVALPVWDGKDMGAGCELHVVPLLVNTYPLVPGATVCTAPVPLPSKTLFAVRLVLPVPPFATVSALVKDNEVADAAPSIGVTNVGLVANTTFPDPVNPFQNAELEPDGVSINRQSDVAELYINVSYEPLTSNMNPALSPSIVFPLGNNVIALVANVLATSRIPTIVPSVGALGNVMLNAPLVVLQRTRSFATAVYADVLIAVDVSPPPLEIVTSPDPNNEVPLTVLILVPLTNLACIAVVSTLTAPFDIVMPEPADISLIVTMLSVEFTVFLKNKVPSYVFSDNSPDNKSVVNGTLLATELRLSFNGVVIVIQY